MSPVRTDRRRFLQLSSMGLVGAALAAGDPRQLVAQVSSAAQSPGSRGERPTKIIFLVSDGMSQGVISMTEQFSQRVRNKGTHFAELLQDDKVAHGWMETYSLDSLVTDSAAAASSWGSGTRIFNGALNMLPDGDELTTIFEVAKSQGWGTGVVTTTTITHATPAGFVVAHPSRNDQDGIAEKYLDAVDIALGGGEGHFSGSRRSDGVDLLGKFQEKGYKVLKSRDELLALDGSDAKLLGTFDRSSLPYTVDHLNDEEMVENIPTLAEMAEAAIASLDKNHAKGWLLQVEAARVDHAAHANDAAGVIWDQVAFDDAVGVALEYARRNPDTLVVVTSDHGNANPGLNSYGRPTNEMFERIALAKASTPVVQQAIRNHANSPADIHEAVKELLGLDLSSDDVALVARMLNNDFDMMTNNRMRSFVGAFNAVVGNHTGVHWTSTHHTEDYTVIAAVGPMQDRYNKLIKNTDVFRALADAMGSNHRNRTMSFEDAQQHARLSPGYVHEGDVFA